MKLRKEHSNRLYKIAIAMIFTWFIFQVVYFALNVSPGIIPDEGGYHIKYIQFYLEQKNLSPFIKEQTEYFTLSNVVRFPGYLYHYLISLILRIPGACKFDYKLIRAISVILGTISVYTFFKTLKILSSKKLVIISSLVMLTNTLMFVFLSMGITYDVPLILLSFISILLTIKFIKEKKVSYIILFFIISFTGSLIKFTFTPLFFIEFIIITIEGFQNKHLLKSRTLRFYKQLKNNPLGILLIITLLLTSLLFFERYGVNIIKYQSIKPNCEEILTFEQCQSHGPTHRNYLLEQSADSRPENGFLYYTYNWFSFMGNSTYGILGHEILSSGKVILIVLLILTLISGVNFIILNLKEPNKIDIYLMMIFVFYFIVLFLFQGYKEYRLFNQLIAVQGRYLFPVLPVIYYVINKYFLKLINNLKWKNLPLFNVIMDSSKLKIYLSILYIIGLTLVFVYFGFPKFIRNHEPKWEEETPNLESICLTLL